MRKDSALKVATVRFGELGKARCGDQGDRKKCG
jgi:hypothetical protein